MFAQERIAADKLLQYDALLVAALGVGCLLGGARPARRLLLRGLRQCTLLMTGVYLLSPLLQVRQNSVCVVFQAQNLHFHLPCRSHPMQRPWLHCAARSATLHAAHPCFVASQTLTRTISTDTIVATTAYLLLIHLYLHDYNFVNNVTDKLTGSVSLGASVFASVLLASRLRSQAQVFAQVCSHR